MAVNLLEKLRELLGAAEADEAVDEPIADEEIVDEPIADEEIADEEIADEEIADEEIADEEIADETPGAQEDETEVAELRATILAQGAEIETLRNRVAELGGEVDLEVEEDAEGDTPDEEDEDIVEAFETDYTDRKARLAEITEGNN